MCEIRFPTNANRCGVKEMDNQENEKRPRKIQQLKLTFLINTLAKRKTTEAFFLLKVAQ